MCGNETNGNGMGRRERDQRESPESESGSIRLREHGTLTIAQRRAASRRRSRAKSEAADAPSRTRRHCSKEGVVKPPHTKGSLKLHRAKEGPILIAPWYGSMALHWHMGSPAARSDALRRLRSVKRLKNDQRALERTVDALDCLDMSEPQRLYLLLMEQQALVSANKPATPQRMAERFIDVLRRIRQHELRRKK